MMKRLLTLLALVVATTAIATAQNYKEYDDVIYTTDGSVVRGTIVEQLPGVSYKIATEGGNIFVFDALKVEKITKEPPVKKYFQQSNIPDTRHYDAEGNVIYKKSPLWAGVGSFCVTGLGQIINGQTRKGLLLMGGHAACFVVGSASSYFASNGLMGGDSGVWESVGLLCLAGYVGTWLYSLIDAPLYASKWNDANGFGLAEGTWLRVDPRVGMANPYATTPAVGLGATITF